MTNSGRNGVSVRNDRVALGNVIALHGFLGLPRDWQAIDPTWQAWDLWRDLRELRDAADGAEPIHTERENSFHAHEMKLSAPVPAPEPPLTVWSRDFCARVRAEAALQDTSVANRPVLIGYSMGARLAMHAALEAPELFRAVVFVSGNPGLASVDERRPRLANDQKWAERFRHESWNELMTAWNGQGVFAGATAPSTTALQRDERDFDRDILAKSLDLWSLGRQDDLRLRLAKLTVPALYLAGEDDAKFRKLLGEMKLAPNAKFVSIAHAGHRLPWDQPAAFRSLLEDFLTSL